MQTDTGLVFGEWMTIKEGMEQQALARLDRLEGYSEDSTSNLYDRVMVNDWEYPEIEGYAYAFPRGNGGERIRKSPVIIHGDWRKRKELVYFAYGSCMNEADVLRTCPTGTMIAKGVLSGYELKFNGYSIGRRGGVANIQKSKGARVEGVLWSVSDKEIAQLDRREGHPCVYQRQTISVRVKHGFIEAFTYQLVQPNPYEFAPSMGYLSLIFDAPVSKKYKEKIKEEWLVWV